MSGTVPWPEGSATGIGPMPGVDPVEALRVALDAVPLLPFLPTLPNRGPGSDPVGRTVALLVDMWAELAPSGWRLTSRPGREASRAAAARQADVDAVEEATQNAGGQRLVKVSVVGPLTLSGALELPSGHRVLNDDGAAADLAGALAEGLVRHVSALRARLPAGWNLMVQIDEPFLGAVLSGALPTPSGLNRYRAMERVVARDRLSAICRGLDVACGFYSDAAALDLLVESGAAFVGAPLEVLETSPEEHLGEAVEAGVGVLAGIDTSPGSRAAAERVVHLWRRLGLPPSELAATVAVCPASDLSSLSLVEAGRVLEAAAETALRLQEVDTGG